MALASRRRSHSPLRQQVLRVMVLFALLVYGGIHASGQAGEFAPAKVAYAASIQLGAPNGGHDPCSQSDEIGKCKTHISCTAGCPFAAVANEASAFDWSADSHRFFLRVLPLSSFDTQFHFRPPKSSARA